MNNFLVVAEREGELALGRDDLLKYAGPSHIVACALSFRLFQRAFRDLSPGKPPMRGSISVRTAFPGEGVLDCIEMIARARTRGRLMIDTSLGPDEAPPAPEGRLYFEIAIGSNALAYWPKPGFFDDPFVDMVIRYQNGAGSMAERQAYFEFKHATIARLMSASDDALFVGKECAL